MKKRKTPQEKSETLVQTIVRIIFEAIVAEIVSQLLEALVAAIRSLSNGSFYPLLSRSTKMEAALFLWQVTIY